MRSRRDDTRPATRWAHNRPRWRLSAARRALSFHRFRPMAFIDIRCCAPPTCAAPASGPTAPSSRSWLVWANWRTTLQPPARLLNERLTAWLPALVEHHCGVGERGGFIQRLEGGTWIGHAGARHHRAAEPAGMKARFWPNAKSHSAACTAWCSLPEEAVGGTALDLGAPCDGRHQRPAVRPQSRHQAIKTNRHRPRPQHRLHRRCRVSESRIPSTSASTTATWCSWATAPSRPHLDRKRPDQRHRRRHSRQDFTKRLLTLAGVPVPRPRGGQRRRLGRCRRIFAVVVKPSDGNHARGVTLNLRTGGNQSRFAWPNRKARR